MNSKTDPNDYAYDISIEDLRRYRMLSPVVILRWLQEAQEFVQEVVRPSLEKPMITFEQLEIELRNQTKRLHDEFGVVSLAVFGSVARGQEQPGSDVDFLVQFEGTPTYDRYMNLKMFLEDLLKCPIDLATRDDVRPQIRSFVEEDARRVA